MSEKCPRCGRWFDPKPAICDLCATRENVEKLEGEKHE